jgi:hypothetical protein
MTPCRAASLCRHHTLAVYILTRRRPASTPHIVISTLVCARESCRIDVAYEERSPLTWRWKQAQKACSWRRPRRRRQFIRAVVRVPLRSKFSTYIISRHAARAARRREVSHVPTAVCRRTNSSPPDPGSPALLRLLPELRRPLTRWPARVESIPPARRSARTCERERVVLVVGRSKICKLAHAFLWEHSYKRLGLARLPGRHGAFLTWACMYGSSQQSAFVPFACRHCRAASCWQEGRPT